MTIMGSADRTEAPDSASEPLAEEPEGAPPAPDRPGEAERVVQSVHRAKPRSSWHVLSQGGFRRYFLGSLISNLGTWLQSTAQVLIAYQVTSSVFTVGLIA